MSTDVIFITFVRCRGKIEISIRHACILKTTERDVVARSEGKSAIIYFSKAILKQQNSVVLYLVGTMMLL